MRGFRFLLFMLALTVGVGMRGQYNPTNPAEPGASYTLVLGMTPSGGGSFNINTVTSYSEGTSVGLRAYTNSYYRFVAWEQDGEEISTSAYFTYTMPAKNVKLTAHYEYSPSNPAEPTEPDLPVYSKLELGCAPASAGYFNISSGNRYEVGSSVYLCAWAHSGFTFENWTVGEEVISTSRSFTYVMPAGNPKLVAHYKYTPSSPGEPSEPHPYRRLHLECNPSGGGYFNVSSGNEYQESSSVYLRAYSNQYYTFVNWTEGDSVVSENYSFNYLMPKHEVTLRANYAYNYTPSNPGEPNKPSATEINLYGMTENGVRGQTIHFPIFLENNVEVSSVILDVQFPAGFVADTTAISVASRASGHDITLKALGENNFRISLLGETAFEGDNGKIFEIPVAIPDTARMGYNYPVILTHGVMIDKDGAQTAISVRNGYIYVEKISEDGLYAKFSFDKLQGRVKFTNQSSDKAVSYLWDFGDGTTSTEKNPLHIYAQSGQYDVKLTAKGEIDEDIAEMTVLINDENTWKIEGTYYLSEEETGVRYFNTIPSLFEFISSSPVSGNVKVHINADKDYSCPLIEDVITKVQTIKSAFSSQSFVLTLCKRGEGSNPVLCFGKKEDTQNEDVVDLFYSFGSSLVCEDVDIQIYGEQFINANLDSIYNTLTSLLAQARTDLTKPMNNVVSTELSTLVASAETLDISSGVVKLRKMNLSLSKKIEEAETSISIYEGVKAIIDYNDAKVSTFDTSGQNKYSQLLGSCTILSDYDNGIIIGGVNEIDSLRSYLVKAVKAQTTDGSDMTLALSSDNYDANSQSERNFVQTLTEMPRGAYRFEVSYSSSTNANITLGIHSDILVVSEGENPKETISFVFPGGDMAINVTNNANYKLGNIRLTYLSDYFDVSEWESVVKLAEALPTGTWDVSKGSESIFTFDGIEIEHGKIVGLNLRKKNLGADFPLSSLSFSNVSHLNLTGNGISGNIGVLPSLLPKLTSFDASDNAFSEVSPIIPTSVTDLNLSNQHISGVSHLNFSNSATDVLQAIPNILLYNHSQQSFSQEMTFNLKFSDLHLKVQIADDKIQLTRLSSNNTFKGNENTVTQVTLNDGSTFPVSLSFDTGDANFIGGIDASDLQATILYAFDEYNTYPFNFTAADTYKDSHNRINVQDVICTVNILLTEDGTNNSVKGAFGSQIITEEPQQNSTEANIFTRDGKIVLSTTKPVAAITVKANGAVTWNLEKYGLTQSVTGSKLVGYALDGNTIPAGETIIGTCHDAGTSIVNASISDSDAKAITVSLSSDATTSIHDIHSQLLDGGQIYDIMGRRHTVIQKGINIIKNNGNYKKVIRPIN